MRPPGGKIRYAAEKAHLLAYDRKDKIGMPFGDETQLALGPGEDPLPP